MAIRVPVGAQGRTKGGEVGDDQQAVAFEDLWEHHAALKSMCARMVRDPSMADDLVQETYLRALKNMDRLEKRPSYMPWLATVARNRTIDEIRSRSKAIPVEEVPEEPMPTLADPGERAELDDTVRRVREALDLLNERERRILTRQVDHDLSLEELAAEDGSSVASVRSVLVRARKKLRDALADARLAVLGPLAGLGAHARRRIGTFNARVQQAAPMIPGGVERLGELVTAGLVSLVLGATATSPTPADVAGRTSDPRPPVVQDAAASTAGTGSDAGEAAPLPPSPAGDAAGTPEASDDPVADATAGVPLDVLLPRDDVTRPEDAATHSFASSRSGSTVFAAGARKGACAQDCLVLFRSDDAGASWTRVAGAGMTGSTILVAPGYPADQRLFAMGPLGLSVSRDGGASFEPVAQQVGEAPVAISPAFSAGDERVLLGSTPSWTYDDGTGATTPFASAPTASSAQHFAFDPGYAASGRMLVGTAALDGDSIRGVVYRCRAGLAGDVCSDATPLPGVSMSPRVAVSSNFAADGVALAWGSVGLFASSDGGATFAPAALPATSSVRAVADDGAGTFYAAVHSTAATGNSGGVLRSNDGGRTWVRSGAHSALANGARTVISLANGTVLAAPLGSAGGGVLCSSDRGATWTPRCGWEGT